MTDDVVREELITAEPVEALAGLLDIDVPLANEVPELWHWVYLVERRPSGDLGPDGHPTSGIPAPPAAGMRRMFAGGRVEFRRRLAIGRVAERVTTIIGETNKQGRSGSLKFVTVRHRISQEGRVAIVEEQDLVYRAPGRGLASSIDGTLPTDRPASLTLAVDERLLFRFSALTYNAHRIHYDRSWCREEGYDDLVVHGPLQALMMAELLRRSGLALLRRRFEYRLVAPMIGPQIMHVMASARGIDQGAEVWTAHGRQTASCNVQ